MTSRTTKFRLRQSETGQKRIELFIPQEAIEYIDSAEGANRSERVLRILEQHKNATQN